MGNFVSQILMVRIGKQMPGAQITVNNGQTIATTTINSLGSTTTSSPVNNLSANNLNSRINSQFASGGQTLIGNGLGGTQSSFNSAISASNSQQVSSISVSDRQGSQNGMVTSISFTDVNDPTLKTQNPMPFPASSTLQPSSANLLSISISDPNQISSIYPPSTPQLISSSGVPKNDLNNLLAKLAPST